MTFRVRSCEPVLMHNFFVDRLKLQKSQPLCLGPETALFTMKIGWIGETFNGYPFSRVNTQIPFNQFFTWLFQRAEFAAQMLKSLTQVHSRVLKSRNWVESPSFGNFLLHQIQFKTPPHHCVLKQVLWGHFQESRCNSEIKV